MRYRFTFFTILTLSLVFFLTSNGWAQKLERLAVLDLEAKWGVEDGFAEALSVIVRDEIHRQKKYSVLSQADLRAVMSRDQILQAMGGCENTSSCLNDFGKLLGTRYMVAGAVAKIGETWTISLRLLDTVGADAGVLNRVSESRQCNENELIDLVKDVSARLLGGKSQSRVALSPEEEQAKLIADHRRKEKGESLANVKSSKSQLTVNTFPPGAKIQIINIKAPYHPGMELEPGRYLLDVTAKGYKEVEKWIELPPGKNHSITMRLQQEKNTGQRSFIDPVTGMKFVGVPQGCFEMGDSMGEGDSDEHPVHEVCLDAYWIGQFEVTQEQWKMVMGDNPSLFKRGDQYPVESVSWDDSQEFLKRLNRTSGRNFRLPTEAEWEYAARGGGQKVRFGTGKDIISS